MNIKGSFRVTVFSEEKHIIVVDPNIKREIKSLIDENIHIHGLYSVKVKSLDAIVKFTTDILEGDELIISVIDQVGVNSQEAQEEEKSAENRPINTEIDLTDLRRMTTKGKDLSSVVNDWAIPQGFKLNIQEGIKKLKKQYRRTLTCAVNGCKFKLNFYADIKENEEKEENPAEKLKAWEELDFTLEENSTATHNHQLDFKPKSKFTAEIIAEIDLLKGKMTSLAELHRTINEKFATAFEYCQIVHRINKLMEKNFGRADQDAYVLMEKIREEINECGGYFKADLGDDSVLLKFIYISKGMLEYAEKFLDMVIVDATYKRNRFNMPIVNVVGINNFGRTIMLGFGLINDETKITYKWFFEQLKQAWGKEPKFFISDECESIIYGIEQNFKSKRLLCSWHLQRHLVSAFSGLQEKDKKLYQDAISLPFITRVEKFQATIACLKNSSSLSLSTKQYLDKKLKNQNRWAKCFTKDDFVVSVATTSRVESLHKILQTKLNSRCSLNQVLNVFKDIEKGQKIKFDEEFKQEFQRHKKDLKTNVENCSLIEQISKTYTPYVVKKFQHKLAKSLCYKYEKISQNQWIIYNYYKKDALKYTVKKVEEQIETGGGLYQLKDKLYCSCKESIYDGHPCRHELALCVMKFKNEEILHFERRWRKDYFHSRDADDNDSLEENKESQEINSANNDIGHEEENLRSQKDNGGDNECVNKVKNPMKVKTRGRPPKDKNNNHPLEETKKTSKKRKASTSSQTPQPVILKKMKSEDEISKKQTKVTIRTSARITNKAK